MEVRNSKLYLSSCPSDSYSDVLLHSLMRLYACTVGLSQPEHLLSSDHLLATAACSLPLHYSPPEGPLSSRLAAPRLPFATSSCWPPHARRVGGDWRITASRDMESGSAQGHSATEAQWAHKVTQRASWAH